jgi:arsenate reductase (glutaredoxin)
VAQENWPLELVPAVGIGQSHHPERWKSCTTGKKITSSDAYTAQGVHMSKVTIYQKPTCSTCRQAVQFLKDSGTPFTAINYYEERFTKPRLKALLKKAGLSPRDILRTKEELYKELNLAKTTLSEDALIDAMVEHPDLTRSHH